MKKGKSRCCDKPIIILTSVKTGKEYPVCSECKKLLSVKEEKNAWCPLCDTVGHSIESCPEFPH